MERKKASSSCPVTGPQSLILRDTEGIGQIQDLAADRAEGRWITFPGTGDCLLGAYSYLQSLQTQRTAWMAVTHSDKGTPPPAMALYPCN